MNPLFGSFDSAMPLLYRASWQAGVLAVVVFAVCRSCPRIPPRWRCVLWSVVLARLLLPVLPLSEASLFNIAHPPVASTEQPVVEVDPEIAPESEPEDAVTLTPYEENMTPSTGGQSFEPVELQESEPVSVEQTSSEVVLSEELIERSTTDAFPIPWTALTYVWLTGVGLMLLREMLQQFRLKRQLRRCRNASDASLLDTLSSCLREMGLRRNVRLLVTSDLVGPAVTGILRPAIILPAHVVKSLDEAELRWLLCHELAHIRRRDTLTYAVWRLARAIHWFNPLAWLAASSVKTAAESAGDERVLSSAATQNHIQYGQSLLRVAELLTEWKPVPTAVGIFSRRDNLKRRITMIADYRKPSRFWTLIAITGVLVLVLTGLTDAMKPQDPSDAETSRGTCDEDTFEQFSQEVDPENPPTVEEIRDAIVANRERIRQMHLLSCTRRHIDEELKYRETFFDVDAQLWREDETSTVQADDWSQDEPFLLLDKLRFYKKRSIVGDEVFKLPYPQVVSLKKERREHRGEYFYNPLDSGLAFGEYGASQLKYYEGPGCLDVKISFFDHLESFERTRGMEVGPVRIEPDHWKGVSCWTVAWESEYYFEPQSRQSNRLVVVPEWGWSVVLLDSIRSDINAQEEKVQFYLEAEVAKHQESGIWFPTSIRYQQTERGDSVREDAVTFFQVREINQPIPQQTFTFTGMGYEIGSLVADKKTLVYDGTLATERFGAWNGESIDWMTIPADPYGLNRKVLFSWGFEYINVSVSQITEHFETYIQSQDEMDWKNCRLCPVPEENSLCVDATWSQLLELGECLDSYFQEHKPNEREPDDQLTLNGEFHYVQPPAPTIYIPPESAPEVGEIDETENKNDKPLIAELDATPTQIQMEMTLIEVDLDGEESGVLQRLVNEKKETMGPDESLAEAILELTEGDRAQILSRPVIRTLDGRQATIQIGEEIPIASDDGNVAYEEIGWHIDLTPKLNPLGVIVAETNVRHTRLCEGGGIGGRGMEATLTFPKDGILFVSPLSATSDENGVNIGKVTQTIPRDEPEPEWVALPLGPQEYAEIEFVMIVSAEVVVEEE